MPTTPAGPLRSHKPALCSTHDITDEALATASCRIIRNVMATTVNEPTSLRKLVAYLYHFCPNRASQENKVTVVRDTHFRMKCRVGRGVSDMGQ